MSLEFREYKAGVSGELCRGLSVTDTGRHKVLINYGSAKSAEGYTIILNRPRAVSICVNKPTMLQKLKEGGCLCPSLDIPQDVDYVIKPLRHRGGRGIKICQSHSIATRRFPPGTYLETYIPTEKEYRVHVVGGLTCVRLKTGGRGPIRSRRCGYRFMFDPNSPAEVRSAAVKAVKALGLDFGAVDVGVLGKGQVVVYEVNSAPRLKTEQIISWYARSLSNLVQRRLIT